MSAKEQEIIGAGAPSDMKSLRCCIPCRLVKSFEQFYEEGCENCVYLQMEGDPERIDDCTTTEFSVRLSSVFKTSSVSLGSFAFSVFACPNPLPSFPQHSRCDL